VSTPPPFLAALGISDDSPSLDERALRRAYARVLKTIDIDTEPERFQALRESLERALQWSAARARAGLAADVATTPSPSPSPSSASAPDASDAPAASAAQARSEQEEAATAAYAAFHFEVVAVFADEAAARAALVRSLSDERLVSIDARTLFEWRVAALLANGWQAGHEHLLDPAVEVFGWNSDHTRLVNFGQVGALLTAAIRDRAIAQNFTPAQRAAVEPLLVRLRSAVPPDPKQLPDEVPALQFLVQRVANWLRIVSPVDPVNQRFEMWRQLPAARQQPAAQAPIGPQPQFVKQKPASATWPGVMVMAALGLLALVGQVSRWSQSPDPQRVPAVRTTLPDLESTLNLRRRQRAADELLAKIRQGRSVPPAHPGQAGGGVFVPLAAPASFDQPWWTPEWAKSPGSGGKPSTP
jgi:hypothetical protein